MGQGRQGDREGAGEAEVRDLDVSLEVDQDVLGLQVPVDDPIAVAVQNAIEDLEEIIDCLLGRELLRLDQALEVVVQELEDQVDLLALAVLLRPRRRAAAPRWGG